MTFFAKGMSVKAAEIDEPSGNPLPGGQEFPGVVEQVTRTGSVLVRLDGGQLWPFCQGSAYAATSALSRWRLFPAGKTEAATAAGGPAGG